MTPLCIGCGRRPDQIDEYVEPADAEGVTPDDFVRKNEPTYNAENGHFRCTDCFYEGEGDTLDDGWITR